jgi:hypothetical protein
MSPTQRSTRQATRRSAQGPRRARATALLGVGALLATGGLAGLGAQSASASSHREAPGILGQPQYDNTDVYAFVSPDKTNTVTLVSDWDPFEEPGGGPNFYPWATDAKYNIKIDNNQDAKADIIYTWRFRTTRTPGPRDSFSGNGTFLSNNGPVTSLKDPNLLLRQTYTLTRHVIGHRPKVLVKNAPAAPSFAGDASMPNYAALRNSAIRTYGGSRKVFAGQADDPFFLDLRVFDVLYGGNCASEVGHDSLAGFNVNSVALQVSAGDLRSHGKSVVGIWSTTDRKNAKGHYTQISRLGQPLVNEAIIPYRVKDTFNAVPPTKDAAALPFVLKPELAQLLNKVCGFNAPTTNRTDLVQVFLKGIPGLNMQQGHVTPSEELRLNTTMQPAASSPNRLGVIGGDKNGFPNGRRLTDDVVDIALQVVGGELVGNANDLGDGVNTNDATFGAHFPYLALPHSGSVTETTTPSETGLTLLDGGGGSHQTPGTGFPAGQLALIGLGLLVALLGAAGATVARRRTAAAHV